MEELQDAIEDAQYMNAMNDDGPRPTRAWKFPTSAEVTAYIDKTKATNPRSLELEGICEGALGFYMVSAMDFQKRKGIFFLRWTIF